MKNKRKNNKGFTLIELLAVIVIMGILMMAAMPLVLNQIQNSKVKSVVSSIDSYVKTIMGEANYLTYDFTAENTIFAIPIECIELEQGGEMALGQWMQANNDYWAYVLVQYDSEAPTYNYAFTFKDSLGYSLYPTSIDTIKEKSNLIKLELDVTKPTTGLYTNYTSEENWAKSGFELNETTQLRVLEAESDGIQGDGVNTCTLCQKGSNYEQVEAEKNPAVNSNKYIMLYDNNQYVLLNDANAENGIELYINNELAFEIPNSLISRDGNNFTITGTGDYDGLYIIYEDGYIEKDGVPIAKSEAKWVNLGENYYYVVHNNNFYVSSNGNTLDERLTSTSEIKYIFDEYVYGENGYEANGKSHYGFSQVSNNQITLENVYDVLTITDIQGRIGTFMEAAIWLADGKYQYYGGHAIRTKQNNSLILDVNWWSNVAYKSITTLSKIENNRKKAMNLNTVISEGTYLAEEVSNYYYNGEKTKNIFFVEDYPFSYSKDMTFKEWIHSEYSAYTLLNDWSGPERWFYVPMSDFDKKIENKHYDTTYSPLIRISYGNINADGLMYCTGEVTPPVLKEEDYSQYGYSSETHKFVGWSWAGGIIKDTFNSYDVYNYYYQDYRFTENYLTFTPVFEEK